MQVKIAEEHGKQKAAYYAGWHAGFSHKGILYCNSNTYNLSFLCFKHINTLNSRHSLICFVIVRVICKSKSDEMYI